LILLDYDGTLQPIVKNPQDAKPSPQTLAMLKRLGSDKRTEVVIISGRDRKTLETWVGKTPVTLVAEHGAFIRRYGNKNWHKTHFTSPKWKNKVRELFHEYQAITPGAMVEEKDWAIVWHYRNASPFLAQKHLVMLRKLLKPIAKQDNLHIKDGKKVIEVNHLDISKGHVTQEWLLSDHDFIMAIGDDTTDEDMFKILPPESYSIKVGRGLSAANYRLPDPAAVHTLLRKL
ncbi:MAG: trehalose-phosphatase, partial [Candidatus Saccharimonadales bacterium]